MVARNDITGEPLVTKSTTNEYRKGFDGIDWSKKATTEEKKPEAAADTKTEDKQ